jgi:hypothetical protein
MACNYQGKIVTNGLVLCLDAADKKSYPGTGTTWLDRSGNGNHVTLVNSPTHSSSNGGILTLNGTNQYAVTANTLNLSNTNAVTIFSMIKVNNYGSGAKILYELSSNFNNRNDCFVDTFADESIGIDFYIFCGHKGNVGYNLALYDKSILNDLKWHSHCCIHDTSQTSKENSVFSDGAVRSELQNPISSYPSNNNNNFANQLFYIGARGGNSLFSPVSLSCIYVYNRVLTQQEIQQNFNATRGRFGI